MVEFTSAQRIASLMARLRLMVEEIEPALTVLIRDPVTTRAFHEEVLKDKEGLGGILLRIEARELSQFQVEEAEIRAAAVRGKAAPHG